MAPVSPAVFEHPKESYKSSSSVTIMAKRLRMPISRIGGAGDCKPLTRDEARRIAANIALASLCTVAGLFAEC
jgi:hypothetical protein